MLSDAIIRTIAYFDIFDHPLSSAEIWMWLYSEDSKSKPTLREVIAELQVLLEKNQIESKDGFYFFQGREQTVKERQKRYRLSIPRWRKALQFGKYLASIPSVRMIAVCNTQAFNATPQGGDIDFFIITSPGAIWRTRLLSVVLAELIGHRPKEGLIQDSLCLSFFITEDALDLSPLAIKDDIYLTYWIRQLVPIYDKGGVYNKFISANRWTEKFLPNTPPNLMNPKREVRDLKLLRWFFKLVPIPENFARSLEMRILPREILEARARKDTSVVISDKILKFHINDRREIIRNEWMRRLSQN